MYPNMPSAILWYGPKTFVVGHPHRGVCRSASFKAKCVPILACSHNSFEYNGLQLISECVDAHEGVSDFVRVPATIRHKLNKGKGLGGYEAVYRCEQFDTSLAADHRFALSCSDDDILGSRFPWVSASFLRKAADPVH
jgi:hypothetical protein